MPEEEPRESDGGTGATPEPETPELKLKDLQQNLLTQAFQQQPGLRDALIRMISDGKLDRRVQARQEAQNGGKKDEPDSQ